MQEEHIKYNILHAQSYNVYKFYKFTGKQAILRIDG